MNIVSLNTNLLTNHCKERSLFCRANFAFHFMLENKLLGSAYFYTAYLRK